MKKSLALSLSAVFFCSVAVYAAETDLAGTIKTKTQTTSASIQKKADTANEIANATGSEKVKAKTSKVSTNVKIKTASSEAKVNDAIKKAGALKDSGVAVSTAAVAVKAVAAPAATVKK